MISSFCSWKKVKNTHYMPKKRVSLRPPMFLRKDFKYLYSHLSNSTFSAQWYLETQKIFLKLSSLHWRKAMCMPLMLRYKDTSLMTSALYGSFWDWRNELFPSARTGAYMGWIIYTSYCVWIIYISQECDFFWSYTWQRRKMHILLQVCSHREHLNGLG